jgi:competence protein ComEA
LPYLSLDQQVALLVLGLILVGSLYLRSYHLSFFSRPDQNRGDTPIEVQGEVVHPGVYLFEKPPTLGEAIRRAGGVREVPEFDAASFSESLEAGTLLTLSKASPRELKVKVGRMESRKLLAFSIPIDLNGASEEDLCLVPGIGEGLAREIVAYRRARGGFQSVEELRDVKGIGDKNYPSFRNFFVVR